MMSSKTMSVPAPNDADLVHASLAGNRDAFGQIVARYQSLVCALAYSATGNLMRSEDLAQETFVAAWRQLPELREPPKLRAWLCGIARNLIRNAQRRAGREPAHLAESFDATNEAIAPEASPPEQAVSREEEALLWRALETIPEIYREPLVLFYREHHSVEAVARRLDLSEDAVKQRLSRGRALLHEQVLALVEGTLERTRPGRAFTSAVLSALPVVGGGVAASTAGATAAKGSTVAKAASSAGGVGLFAGVVALLAALGGYVGWQMGDTPAQTVGERQAVLRFWRVVAGGFLLFVLPAFALLAWRRSHPWVLDAAALWLGALYLAAAMGFAIYAWSHHRRMRGRETGTEAPAPIVRRRLLIWTGLGTFGMLLVLGYALFDTGGWRTQRLNSAEAVDFIASHPTAEFRILEYQSGSRVLAIVDTARGRRTRFAAPLDERTRAALTQSGAAVTTSVQGRDFEILGWPGRYLFVLAVVIAAAGLVTLGRMLKRSPADAAPGTSG